MKMKLSRPVKWTLGILALAAPTWGADDDFRNWIDFGVGGSLVHGDKAAFQQRTQTPTGVWGGVTDFHYEQDVGKKGLFEVDGRGIFDERNYSLFLSYKDPDYGYLKAGFEEFKTYYDASGGYFAGNGAYFGFDSAAPWEVDRRHVFFEAGLEKEGIPQIHLSYDLDGRDGMKNSTSWGDTAATGGAGTRKIVPSFLKLNEDRHTVALDVSHQIGNTEAGLGGRLQFSTYDNGRYERRTPGAASDRIITQREGTDTDLYSFHAWSDTELNDKFNFTSGYIFTRLDTDISGSRITGADYDAQFDASFARRQNNDHGFLGLNGGSQVDQHVATISLMYRPTEKITIVPSVRIESQDQTGVASFTDTVVTTVGGVPLSTKLEDVTNGRKREFLDVTESIDIRYTGITNWVLYARTEWLEGDGTLSEHERFIDLPVTSDIVRYTDSGRFTQKYAVGANWYATRKVNTAFQYYHKERSNDYTHTVTNIEGLYPGFIQDQDFSTDDANVRVTWKILNNLTTISRYDLQFNTIDSRMGTLADAQSAQGTSHIITESVTWSPLARLYLQASGSYTIDRFRTPATDLVPGLVQVAENNYYTASGTIGYALTEKTDTTLNYNYYLADNYDPSNFTTGMAYGAGLEEHEIGLGIVHRFNKRMQLSANYAFLTSHDATSGGHNDFDAHVLSTSLRVRF